LPIFTNPCMWGGGVIEAATESKSFGLASHPTFIGAGQ
jgi:hypothetical protein